MVKLTKKTGYYVLLSVALLGSGLLLFASAAITTVSIEPELGPTTGCATPALNQEASGGSYISFGCSESEYGAQLPISYDIASLTGTVRYVAPNGSNSNSGTTVNAPYATLAHAHSNVPAGGTIVLLEGIYRNQFNTGISKSIRVIAYPGHIPEFRGSVLVPSAGSGNSGWNIDGTQQWRSYQPIPLSDGSGIPFSTGMQNLTGDGVGRYPDQVWINNSMLQQVSNRSQLQDGKFWVDRTTNRLYMTTKDAQQSGIEVTTHPASTTSTSAYRALSITGQNVKIEGIKFSRYANTPNAYGVITAQQGAHNLFMKNVEISDSSFMAMIVTGGNSGSAPFNDNTTLENVTMERNNWMGLAAIYTNDLTLKGVKIAESNQFDEFTYSPQSGALKGGKTWRTKVTDSLISENHSHGLWFDQSNYDTTIANNKIIDNLGRGVFFEISDKLLLINNYIRSGNTGQPVKLAGSSGLQLVNNTIIGGTDPVGVYVDDRSKPGCAVPDTPNCAHTPSDWDKRRSPLPVTLDWMPRIDLMINNIIAYPATASSSLCGAAIPLCITTSHGSSVVVPLQNIIHKADASRGIPQTIMNGNVYANGSSTLIRAGSTNYSTLAAFTGAMAESPVSISGIEAISKQGNSWVNLDGSATSVLSGVNGQAIPIPTDPKINQYIPAGTRRYGTSL
jgi:hypothetical protein